MNKSSFYGKISNYGFSKEAKKIEIKLLVEEIRKNSRGEKIVEYVSVNLVAWDTAAETLFEYTMFGDYLLIKDASYRNDKHGDYFRINDFKIIGRGTNNE